MNYNKQTDEQAMTVSISGELTYKDHTDFNELMNDIESAGVNSVICDLEKLEFIDSSGLGLLLLLKDRSKKSGWNISVQNQNGQVAKMLQYTNISSQLS